MFPVRDHTGAIVPNTYFMCLDYSVGADAVGENFDFQDMVFVVTNVKPVGGCDGAEVCRRRARRDTREEKEEAKERKKIAVA